MSPLLRYAVHKSSAHHNSLFPHADCYANHCKINFRGAFPDFSSTYNHIRDTDNIYNVVTHINEYEDEYVFDDYTHYINAEDVED